LIKIFYTEHAHKSTCN